MIPVIVALIISIILESSVTTIPLTLGVIAFSAVILRRNEVFVLAFFAGLLLDIFAMRVVGLSSLVFVTVVYLVFLYENKFEVETLHFVFFLTLLSAFFYAFILGLPFIILSALIVCLITSFSFQVFSKFNKKPLKYA